jgi:hypothetical protein
MSATRDARLLEGNFLARRFYPATGRLAISHLRALRARTALPFLNILQIFQHD